MTATRCIVRLFLVLGLLGAVSGCIASGEVAAPVRDGFSAACFAFDDLDRDDRDLAEAILAEGLDNEALYTLAGSIKPMSSLRMIRLRTARLDSLVAVAGGIPDSVSLDLVHAEQFERVSSRLRCGPIETVVVPFRMPQGDQRFVQMTVVNRAHLNQELARHRVFWARKGLLPGAHPAVVVTSVEHASSYDRFRGYGHLFGYPDHAVDFFVRAAREADSTGQFVERDFFQIPTHASETGRFVYAVPKGYMPTEVDSSLFWEAVDVLADYRVRRERYRNPDSTLRAADLLREWYESNGFVAHSE